ncbi:MAG: hypothetical protein JWR34_5215 [Mycobacterium sp.]|nr:hypothetical protein [Mycobacterium sp.]
MVGDISLFAGCESISAARTILRDQIQLEVDAMAALVRDADAFDVIELMRLRELGVVPQAAPGGSALAIEIVAAVLLSRGSRKPSALPREGTRPHMAVNELHHRALRLMRLAQARQLTEAALNGDSLSMLAAEYQGAVMGIRNLQYSSVRDAHEAQLFDNERAASLMQKHLGYTYPQVVAVRRAIGEVSSQRMTELRDGTADIMLRNQGIPPTQVPAAEAEELMSQMVALMFLPGDRATISPGDVAPSAGVSDETALAVLTSFSQFFDSAISATDRVYDMLVGTNPFLSAPLISDGAVNFVSTSNELGNDSLRRIFEKALSSNSKDFTSYDQKLRVVMSEQIALDGLASILDTPPSYAAFKYFAPENEDEIGQLGSGCANPTAVGKQVEGDGLFIIDDVAIVVETKGKSMADQSRRGDVTRLSRDLAATIGDACEQAKRIQRLIETNRGIWLADKSWLDLSQIREVRCVTALLDDVGPLGTAIGRLQQAGIVSEDKPPWISSLHDLTTIAAISDRPAEFLHYLRVRTDSPVTNHFWALDELDLYMLFLQGDLWFDADGEDAINMVDDHCAELNAWMDRHKHEGTELPEKPSFNAVPAMLELVDAIAALREPGWLRCGADLLSLAGAAQQQLLDVIAELGRRAEDDGNEHHGAFSFDSTWERTAFFFAISPVGMNMNEVETQLFAYMQAKATQIGAERSYGLIFDTHQRLRRFLYL